MYQNIRIIIYDRRLSYLSCESRKSSECLISCLQYEAELDDCGRSGKIYFRLLDNKFDSKLLDLVNFS